MGRPVPPATSHAPREARTENITFIVHDQLYKRNVPTCARVRGPFHERALEKASERGRGGGGGGGAARWGARRSRCFPLGTRAAPHPRHVPPGWAEPPHHWWGPWGGDAGWWGCPPCPLHTHTTPPRVQGQPSPKSQSGTWGRGECWKLDTALSNHKTPKIHTPPPLPQHTHTLMY